MSHGDDHFQVDTLDLADQIVQLGAAFGLQHRLVEVEEGVGSVGHLLGGHRSRCGSRCRSSCGRSRSGGRSGSGGLRCFQSAIAARSSGSGRPEGIAPAQFVGAVLPDQVAVAAAPVVGVDRRASCEGGTSHGCNSEHDRYFVQFLHGSPHGEKSRSRAAINRTLQVTTTKNVGLIVPHVFVHS